jgi:hypothetical protein
VRAVGVVELLELAQGVEQVPLVPDQGPVEKLAAAGLYPSLHERVHSRHLDTAEQDRDPGVLEHVVEQPENLPSRSRIRNRARLPASSRSTMRFFAAWATLGLSQDHRQDPLAAGRRGRNYVGPRQASR